MPARRRRSADRRDSADVAWREYLDVADIARATLTTRLQQRTGLSLPDYAVLLALHQVPGRGLRPSQLAAQIHWDPSRLSHHMSRMVHRGLLHREHCEIDHRGAEITITERGADIFRVATPEYRRAVEEVLTIALTADQLDALTTIAARLREHLHEYAARHTPPPPEAARPLAPVDRGLLATPRSAPETP